jgi:5S rRNA maturation endonuclease (ribonuclease M5)
MGKYSSYLLKLDFIRENKDIIDKISKYLKDDTWTGYKKAKQAYLTDIEFQGKQIQNELVDLLPKLYKVDIEKFENYVREKTLNVGDKIKLRFLTYEEERDLAQYSDTWSNEDCNPQHFAFLYDPKKMFKYTLY